MDKIGRITLVALDGEPPEELALQALPASEHVAEIIRLAFAPFLTEDSEFLILDGLSPAIPPAFGLHLIYLYGHAWLSPNGPQTSIANQSHNQIVENGKDLLGRIVDASVADRTIIIFDCCHAAAFDPIVVKSCIPRLVVYGSSEDEKAIALSGERASRLSLAISEKLGGRSKSVDLAKVFAEVADRLDGDGVLRGQTVTYRFNGLAIRMSRGHVSKKKQRERTVTIIRNILIVIGAFVSSSLIVLGWFYRTHTHIEIDFSGLQDISHNIKLSGYEENPEFNINGLFVEERVTTNHSRLWVPASNVILRINATYSDGKPRALAFHLNLKPSFISENKFLSLTLPHSSEVKAHPNMAFVPATAWLHDRERETLNSAKAFWIDIQPPTISEYMEVANKLHNLGKLTQDNSFVLSWGQAENTTGATQVDLSKTDKSSDINNDIEDKTLSVIEDVSDIVVGSGKLPCESCPAPMTRYEANLFCKSRNMRLPTNLEWELAVRGVDGRTYPWGNQFDEARANVPGLPDKGKPSPSLKPVNEYFNELSPFGLIDSVGNAGDWVINESGAYKRIYMGATYRYNQEDATAFRSLPLRDEDYILASEITARCVDDEHFDAPH